MDDLQIWICEENIERFRAQLAETLDDQRRQTVSQLLKQETAVLDGLRRVREESRRAERGVAQGEAGNHAPSDVTLGAEIFDIKNHITNAGATAQNQPSGNLPPRLLIRDG